MQPTAGFNFFQLKFDEGGTLANAGEFSALQTDAANATDAIFLAHGFRNSESDATTLYSAFLTNLRADFNRPQFAGALAGRKFVVGAVYWPSKPFQESFGPDGGSVQAVGEEGSEMDSVRLQLEDLKQHATTPEQIKKIDDAILLLPEIEEDTAAQDLFVANVLSLLDNSELDSTEGLLAIRAQQGSGLLNKLNTPVTLPLEQDPDAGDGTVMSLEGVDPDPGGQGTAQSLGSFFGTVMGRVGQFLNLTTWYIMKNRSGVVGATGVAQAVRDLKKAHPNLRIHLVGHSLGGRLMAGCAKSLAQDPKLKPDSLTLLEAAFSHYGFSDNNGDGTTGFFRGVITQKIVQGPLLATFSFQDTVVGRVYAIASRLADDNVQAIGDANDAFGGIGRNGAQKTKEAVFQKLQKAGTPYAPFKTEVITCLDGSGGLIKDHGDVTNADVTYAVASSLALT